MTKTKIHRVDRYKAQRDMLVYFLLEQVGVTRTRIAQILGMSRQAVAQQFPKKKR